MRDAIDAYFAGERDAGALIMAIGLAAIGLSVLLLWRWGGSLFKGVALPLTAIGLVQISVGATLLLRTPGQVRALHEQRASDPAALTRLELARMERVMSQFRSLKRIELLLLAAGIALVLAPVSPFWIGIGMGLLVQAAVMLPFDIVAEMRARHYIAGISAVR